MPMKVIAYPKRKDPHTMHSKRMMKRCDNEVVINTCNCGRLFWEEESNSNNSTIPTQLTRIRSPPWMRIFEWSMTRQARPAPWTACMTDVNWVMMHHNVCSSMEGECSVKNRSSYTSIQWNQLSHTHTHSLSHYIYMYIYTDWSIMLSVNNADVYIIHL